VQRHKIDWVPVITCLRLGLENEIKELLIGRMKFK